MGDITSNNSIDNTVSTGTPNDTFQKKIDIMYDNTKPEFTNSDFNFLKYASKLYGDALSVKGLNVLDPVYANMFHYNKMQNRSEVDFPRVNRSYAFFTRPELNFSYENLNAIPFFKWLFSKPIGKMIMSSLTDPNYFINAPGALNSIEKYSYAEIADILNEYENVVKSSEKGINSNAGVKNDSADFSSNDDSSRANELENLNIDSIAEDTEIFDNMKGHISGMSGSYTEFINAYETASKKLEDKLNLVNTATSDYNNSDMGLNIFQAKNIMKSTHNSIYDNFNFTSPFIPILQNTCTNVTGAKDFNIETFSYDSDEFGSNLTVPTGMDELWGGGTLTTTHDDIIYGPTSLLFMVWVMYQHYVSRGYITTTRTHIMERILDYTCSIYVFVIGGDGRTIERFGKYTGCSPSTFPFSQQLEHSSTLDPEMLRKIQITWNFNRFEPMNPEIFTDFNFISETEWLFKLKNWDTLYDRKIHLSKTKFLDYGKELTPVERSILHSAGRNSDIWDIVSEKDIGMSGNLPRALIAGSDIDIGNDISFSDLINNYWGGFPYINKGSELIWVMPRWKDKNITRDSGYNGTTKNSAV